LHIIIIICDPDIDPITFIYELDQYFLEIYRMCEKELSTSRLSKLPYYIYTDIQTDRHN